MMKQVQYVECPRDAMQGWPHQIPTSVKVNYLQQLLEVGFDVIDAVSFVSAKAIPQMADSEAVLSELDFTASKSKLLAIVANERGAINASGFKAIQIIGYPFSISETFQLRNANKSIAESSDVVKRIQDICIKSNKQLSIYFSMAFGNPYGDPFHAEVIHEHINRMSDSGISSFVLADTVGMATPAQVYSTCKNVVDHFPQFNIGAHLHSSPGNWKDKLEAAINAGCLRIDGAINGVGGCPMAGDALVGNLDTMNALPYLIHAGRHHKINLSALNSAQQTAAKIFN